MTKQLFATSHWGHLKKEQQQILDLLPTIEFRSRVYSLGELQSCFARWSLSSSSIQLQTRAKLLNSLIVRVMSSSAEEPLTTFTHQLSSLMHSDSSILVLA